MFYTAMEGIQYLIDRLQKLDEKFDDKLDKILVQTTRTNGRVNALEKRVNEHDKKIETQEETRNYNKGRERVWWIVIGAAAAVAAMLIQYYINK